MRGKAHACINSNNRKTKGIHCERIILGKHLQLTLRPPKLIIVVMAFEDLNPDLGDFTALINYTSAFAAGLEKFALFFNWSKSSIK